MILTLSSPSLLQFDLLSIALLRHGQNKRGDFCGKAERPTTWPGALREGLGQPDLGLLADLAMVRSAILPQLPRTAWWQLPGILRILPSTNAVFCFHSGPQKSRSGGVTSQMTSRTASDHRSRPFLPAAISYSLNESSSSFWTVYSNIFGCIKIEILAGADGERDFVSFENLGTKSRACSICFSFFKAYLCNRTRLAANHCNEP